MNLPSCLSLCQELDPDPRNELGKDLLSPEREHWLLENGRIFAMRISEKTTVSCRRSLRQAWEEAERDAIRTAIGVTPLSRAITS